MEAIGEFGSWAWGSEGWRKIDCVVWIGIPIPRPQGTPCPGLHSTEPISVFPNLAAPDHDGHPKMYDPGPASGIFLL